MRHTRRRARRGTRRNTQRHSWGYHLMVDARACNPASIRSKSHIAKFAKDMVKAIDMVAYGPPQIVRFGKGNKYGYTLVQLIETSDITAHFTEEHNDVYFDVFSCKPFSAKTALKVIEDAFHPEHTTVMFRKRQA